MRNRRLILSLSGAIICGLLGVTLVTRYLSNVRAYARDLGEVVVAKAEIPLGEKITAEDLMLLPIPNGSAPEGVFRKVSEVEGRVAVTPIGVREIVTNLKLAPEGTGGGLSAVIPAGYRAMTVKVDDIVGVSGFIMPGSFVDVVAIIVPVQATDQAQKGPISKIVLQSIKVLASGPRIDSPENQRTPSDVKAVTLQVTPEQAEKLVLAANEGKLQLVMRNYTDQDDAQTAGANKGTLLNGESAKPLPDLPNEKSLEKKPTAPKPTIRRTSHVMPPEVKTAVIAPVARKSVELIEGSKRREVDVP
jgi:pilus assembly protein CpaB